jgi:hypothetical protein
VTRRADIVATAQTDVGTIEFPSGSNRTVYGQRYGLNGVPWCAIWTSDVYQRNGHSLRAELTQQWAYTPAGLQAGRRAGWAIKHRNARPGDIVFFDFPGGEAVDHVGIVTANLGDRGVATIEGNTSSGTAGSQSNGGGVYARTRPWSLVAGVLSPPYLTDDTPPRPLPPPAPPVVVPQLPPPATTATSEAHMLLVVDNVGFFALGPNDVIVGLTITEYAQTVDNSRGVPILRMPQGPGQLFLESSLKRMAKALA